MGLFAIPFDGERIIVALAPARHTGSWLSRSLNITWNCATSPGPWPVSTIMNKSQLPATIRHFIEEQATRPVSDVSKVRKSDLKSPYGSYWYRAIACMMLSGRVHPKSFADGSPNMTDVNRIGKEANFNQYLFERVARFLVSADVIGERRMEAQYQEGPNIDAFWAHDEKKLPEISRHAVFNDVKKHAGSLPKRATPLDRAHLLEFLTLFFACFKGRAILESKFPEVLRGFSRLPREDLLRVAEELDLKTTAVDPDAWSYWVELKEGKVLIDALGEAEWIYGEEREKVYYICPSEVGLAMLGLDKPLPPPHLPTTLKAGTKLGIFAGTGLERQKLVPLFRHCTIKKIGEVCEFQLDRKRLAQQPAGTSPGEELRKALEDLDPLPPAITELLGTKSKLGGQIDIRGCSALVKPENEDVLKAIRQHPNLKGYIEAGAPPGYLIIKPTSDPFNFIHRCRMLGFTVTIL
jgi:hypothetical protein